MKEIYLCAYGGAAGRAAGRAVWPLWRPDADGRAQAV